MRAWEACEVLSGTLEGSFGATCRQFWRLASELLNLSLVGNRVVRCAVSRTT